MRLGCNMALCFFIYIFSMTSKGGIFEKVSAEVGVPSKLLKAICYVESGHNPQAYNHGDGDVLNHAFGICQVLYTTALLYKFEDKNCKRDFRQKEKNYENCKLFDPEINLRIAAKIIKYNLNRYNNDLNKTIGAYNTGSAKICTTGYVRRKNGEILYRCKIGGILNQKYIDKVKEALLKFN